MCAALFFLEAQMSHVIRIHQNGGPEQMQWEEVAVGDPGPGEVRVRNTAVGLNFIDTYHRSGLYPMPLPLVLGSEGAGVVEAVGPKVREFKVGDHVAYAQPIGAYAEVLIRPAARLVKIPAGIKDETAAAMMLKGMTAWYLCRRTYRVKKGDTIVVHAAAGGVGQILCQWSKHLASRKSPRERVYRWSMTASARTPSWNHSTAWRRSG